MKRTIKNENNKRNPKMKQADLSLAKLKKIKKTVKVKSKTIPAGNKIKMQTKHALVKSQLPEMKNLSNNIDIKPLSSSKSPIMMSQKKLPKVEDNTSPPTNKDKKGENKPAVVKKEVEGRKKKLTKVKGLKPISNIKCLARSPQKKLKLQPANKDLPERGVCYFSHIPHGFYEKELKAYCSQFGKVTGVYHPVSKSGNSRGYAFVEFEHKEVAEVVAETMNNYLMFNRLLKCEYVPPEAQKPWVFKQKRNNKKEAILKRKENLKMQSRKLNQDEMKKWKKRRLSKVNSFHKKLAKLGVDYEFQVNDTSLSTEENKK